MIASVQRGEILADMLCVVLADALLSHPGELT